MAVGRADQHCGYFSDRQSGGQFPCVGPDHASVFTAALFHDPILTQDALWRSGGAGAALSPPGCCYEHRAEIEVVVDGNPTARDSPFDVLRLAIGTALAADRTLGGRCDYIAPEALEPVLAIDGNEGLKAEVITVILAYASLVATAKRQHWIESGAILPHLWRSLLDPMIAL